MTFCVNKKDKINNKKLKVLISFLESSSYMMCFIYRVGTVVT